MKKRKRNRWYPNRNFSGAYGLISLRDCEKSEADKKWLVPRKRSRPVLVFPENGFQIESRKKKVES